MTHEERQESEVDEDSIDLLKNLSEAFEEYKKAIKTDDADTLEPYLNNLAFHVVGLLIEHSEDTNANLVDFIEALTDFHTDALNDSDE